MEVHHLLNNKQNRLSGFKRYLNEFLILFLAISASFVVENYRERYIEHHREKQYIESLISDIESDTMDINEARVVIEKQIKGIDSLLKILEKPETDSTIGQLYYYSFNYLGSTQLFSSTDGTISQLKNAGGLRLIREEGASDSIMVYYNMIDNIKYNTEFNLRQFERILTMMKEMFEFKVIRNISAVSQLYNKQLEIHITSPNQLNTYYNEAILFASSLNEYNKLLTAQNKKAISLINFLKESYNLD